MATNKSATEQPAASKGSRKEPERLNIQTFTKTYIEWGQQQQQAAQDYQRRCAEAYLDLVNSLNEIAAAAQKPVLEAQQKLMAANLSLTGDAESWQNYLRLQQELAQTIAEASNDPSHYENVQKAHEAYAAAIQRAAEQAQRQNEKAYQRYLKVVKDAWARLDADNPDPEELRAVEWSTRAVFQGRAF